MHGKSSQDLAPLSVRDRQKRPLDVFDQHDAGRSSVADGTSTSSPFRFVLKHPYLVALTVAASIALGFVFLALSPRLYTASSLVEIGYSPLVPTTAVEDRISQRAQQQGYLLTQVKRMKSLGVADRVLQDEQLAAQVREEVNGPMRHPIAIALQTVSAGLNRVQGLFREDDPSESSNAPADDPNYRNEVVLLERYSALIEITPIRGTALLRVSATTSDPELSRELANAHSESFIAHLQAERRDSLLASLDFLREQGEQLRLRLVRLQTEIADYAADNKLVALSQDEAITVQHLADLMEELAEATTSRIESESLLQEVERRSHTSSALDDQSIESLRVTLEQAKADYAHMQSKFGPAYPAVVQLEGRIAALEKTILSERDHAVETLRAQYQGDLATEKALKAQIEKQRSQAFETFERVSRYELLRREEASMSDLYQELLRQMKEAQVSSASRGSSASISDFAPLPRKPSSPRTYVVLLAALTGGLLLGCAGAWFVDARDDTPDVDEIPELLALPLFGTVPKFDDRPSTGSQEKAGDGHGWRPTKKAKAGKTTTPVTTQPARPSIRPRPINPSRAVAHEMFLRIRANIMLSSAESPPRSLVITSASASEGKTTLAGNLAVALAESDHRVLLIDADMRRPALASRFDLPERKRGLTDYIAGQADLKSVIFSTPVPQLDVIPVGCPAPNPTALIGSQKMAAVIKELEADYDFILLDSPPVLPVADALMLSQIVDGVVFVVRSGKTTRRSALAAREQLSRVNAPLLGLVVNDVLLNQAVYGQELAYYNLSADV